MGKMRHTKLFKGLLALVQASFLGTGLLVSPLAVAPVFANEAADIDQCANDPAPSSPANGCSGAAGENGWVNGNLNASKSVFLEGDSIPYRIKFTDLAPSSSNTVTIEWDTTKSGKHAIDYITTWNRSVLNADPCLGVSGCAASTTFPIPADPQVSGAGVTQAAGVLTMFGGTITAVSPYFYAGGAGFAGDKQAGITITFTASVVNPVLAWGGHIASRQDWGNNNSAVAITGSPYHTRILDLNGSGGNQDRSLKEDAVIFPGSITVIKQATPEGSTPFAFTAGPAPLADFSLVDDGTSANTRVFAAMTIFTTYTVTETLPQGWQLDGRACQTTSQNGGSTSNSGASGISINLKEGENVTCTFSNSETPRPSLNITKDASVPGGTANVAGEKISYVITVANTGNVTLHNVVVTDPYADPGSIVRDATDVVGDEDNLLEVGETWGYTAQHTVSQAEIDSNGGGDGNLENTATADSDETGPDTDDASVPVGAVAGLNIVKTASVPGGTANVAGEVISYTISVQNTGNVTLTNVIVSDPFISNLTRIADAVGDNDNLLEVGETWAFTASHVVTQAELDNNGGGDGLIDNIATADSDQTGPDTDDANVPVEQSPSFTILKEDDGDTFSAVGDVIDYVITIENTGNTTLTLTVTDPNAPEGLDCSADAGLQTTVVIPVGQSASCSAFHVVTQLDIDAGHFLNEACADDGQGGLDEECAEVDTPGDQNPELSIIKSDETGGFDSVGDVIDYVIVAENTGNVTLHGVVVTDDQVSDTLFCLPITPVADFEPGDQIVCTASHTITQEDLDAGSYFNEACVDDTEGPAPEACDDVTTVGDQNPALSIEKEATEDGFDAVGQVIHYTIVARNVGNVTLHDVVVTDEQVTDLDCTPDTPVDLAPGESITCTASHTVVEADFDTLLVFNKACVDDAEGAPETGADEVCDEVNTPGQELEEETHVPTQPPTDSAIGGDPGRPSDAAWLLVIGLALALGGIVLMTPSRRRSKR
jgi:uncharacterized repeat protein (TIGR01451 family)